MARSRVDEYVQRMRELGYGDVLRGMDDEDIEWELDKMDGRRQEPQTPVLGRTFRPPDRDFAERMFRMFERRFDPNWEMPDLDGPEYRQPPKSGRGLDGGVVQLLPDRPGEKLEVWGLKPYKPGKMEIQLLSNEAGGGDGGAGAQPVTGSVTGGTGKGGRDENWSIDPFGMFPQYDGGSPATGNSTGSGTLDRYRSNELGPAAGSPGYIDAGGSRNNEARAGTADDFTFTADPLESMTVRGGAKSNTYGDNVRQNSDGTPRPHQGVDIVAKKGTKAMAVEDGKVIDVDNDEGGYGHYVKVEFEKNGKKYYAFYAHLNGPPPVKVGDAVRAGQVIGYTGTSGNAEGMPEEDHHLHFEVHTQPGYGPRLEGRRDPMKHFRAKMEVNNDL